MTFPISAEKECAPVAHVSAYVIVFQCVTLWWKTPPKLCELDVRQWLCHHSFCLHHHMCFGAHVCTHVRLSEWPRKLCRISLTVFPQLISLTSCCLLLSTLCASVRSESSPGIYLVTLCFFFSSLHTAKQKDISCCDISMWVHDCPPCARFRPLTVSSLLVCLSRFAQEFSSLARLCLWFLLWMVVHILADKVWHKNKIRKVHWL